MKRFFIYFSLFTCLLTTSTVTKAQDIEPIIAPTVLVLDEYGEVIDTITNDSKAVEAPVRVSFKANPQNNEGWNPAYEWRITRSDTDGSNKELYLDRFDEDTEYTFEESGSYSIVCWATFTRGDDKKEYGEEWMKDMGKEPFRFSVATSHLEMPNAFSPNGDETNDTYGPKGMQDPDSPNKPKSIVEFHMTIFNRWGQKLYETRDMKQGWDGTFNGRPCKEGVYYALVTALGADGIKYKFKKDVNLLRGKRERESSSSSEQ